jgi:hypothetical protein
MLGTGYVQTTTPRGRSIQSHLFTEGKNTLWIILSLSPIKSRSVGQQPHRAALAQDASAEADTTGSACWDELLDLTFQ